MREHNNSSHLRLYHLSITLHEILGYSLVFPLSKLGKKILAAYASQKYSIGRNNGFFYLTEKVENIELITERRIINHIVINFDAWLRKIKNYPTTNSIFTSNNILIDDTQSALIVEKEYRRYVDSCHPLLVEKLGISCNDLSNMKFLSREIELQFGNYRLCINLTQQTYTIQYKKKICTKRVFLPHTLTQEVLFHSNEGPIHVEPIFVRDITSLKILGLATFFDTNNLSIKTVYLKNKHITLYQRIIPDNYERSYPFTLECERLKNDGGKEEEDNVKATLDFFELSWRLNAHLPKNIITNYASISSKPIHVINEKKYYRKARMNNDSIYLKYDGIPATLQFYPYHFILKNSTTSSSYLHSLEPWLTYVLMQYSFLVETNLYTPAAKESRGFPKPAQAMVIIDIHSTAFSASSRMNIIQTLRKRVAPFLYEYFIFFQGEIRGEQNVKKNVSNQPPSLPPLGELMHNHIYEVKLININEIAYIVKERPDKTKPNSGKLINTVVSLQMKRNV